MKALRFFFAVLCTMGLAVSCLTNGGPVSERQISKLVERYAGEDTHFLLLNDAGANGYKNQKQIAEVMGVVAKASSAKFVVSAGDQLHMRGAQSQFDPIFVTNFENMYTSQNLLWIPWYVVSGNHEYHGNDQALVEYSNISPRWTMPSRYYTVENVNPKTGASIRIIMLDTTPVQVSVADNDRSDAHEQNTDAQLEWLENTLSNASPVDWTIIVGHHPVYCNTKKSERERIAMQKWLLPVLEKHPEVAYYVCGHIHTFQHVVHPELSTEFIVNASACTDRHLYDGPETPVYYFEESGFLTWTVKKDCLSADLVDRNGKVKYTFSRTK